MTGDATMIVFTTVASDADAAALADRLVEDRLAACVQVVPNVRSVYRWEGAVRRDDEVQLAIKTVASCVDAIEDLFRAHHPYDVPELVAVRADRVGAGYRAWIEDEVRAPARTWQA